MGTAQLQADLWGQAPNDWASIQEPMSTPLWKAMLDEARVDTGTRVLDAGCGGGGASVLMAERGALISGIDAAEGMITLASKRVPGGDFQVGDIELLPFDDDAFDAVFASNSVQYSADRVATLRGFGRVCRPGGRVVAGLFGPPEKVTYRALFKAVRDALPEPPPGAGPFELSMPGVLEGLFEEAGLTVVGSGEVDCPFRYPDFETFWRANSSAGPVQGAMRAAGVESVRSSVREAVGSFVREDGSIEIQPNVFTYVVASI
ncbi:MAG: class I SAM-dependent methyltransferase [Trueperaceae bacterium]|nr:MAG: class I SAM-dependent methyltransferase [Trueperaceae bacterium]